MNNDKTDNILSYKVCLAGDSGVGKSNLLTRFDRNQFRPDSKATIGLEFVCKQMKIGTANIKCQIWDTCGQEQFKAMTQTYYRGAKGVLLVFDLADRSSFESIEGWYQEVKTKSDKDVAIFLVGNKCDLVDSRQVKKEEGLKFALSKKIKYYETSALDSTNVNLVFNEIVREAHEITILSKKAGKGRDSRWIETHKTAVSLGPDFNAITQDKSGGGCCN